MSAKGEPKTPGSGRKPGSLNKVTVALREAILQAADEVEGEGKSRVDYLKWLAKTQPSSFAMLLGRVLPTDVNLKDVTPGKAPREFVPPTDMSDASDRYARALRGEDFSFPVSPADEPATHH